MYTSQDRVSFVIPLTPPSVNHYKVPVKIRTREGIKSSYALTPEAQSFLGAMALFARGETLIPSNSIERKSIHYGLFVNIYQGLLPMRVGETRQRSETGDGDNYWKCVADGLGAKWGRVIHDDRRVRTWMLEVWDNDRENPRTEVTAVRCFTNAYDEAVQEFAETILHRHDVGVK